MGRAELFSEDADSLHYYRDGLRFRFFRMPHIQVMPAFAKEVLDADAAKAVLLITGAGVGSLMANLALSLLGNSQHKNRLLKGYAGYEEG